MNHGTARVGTGRARALAALLALAGVCGAAPAGAITAGVMGGGPFYAGGTPVMNTLRASGFNTVILWTIHVYYPSGDLIFNDVLVCSNGAYVGNTNWPAQLATLKQATTSVSRIEVAVGSGGGPNDFLAIQKLIADGGTGTNSILYRNFAALIAATGADAICFNDESLYDVATMVSFGQMLAVLGRKVTLCPYNNPTVWQNVKSQLGATVDAVYLQCYAGGAGNNPAAWNAYFGGLRVSPGLWCRHGAGCAAGDTAAAVATKMNNWRNSPGIPGGWMWLYDDMQKCTNDAPAAYAAAIAGDTTLPTDATWDGGGANDAWTTGANWIGDLPPATGAILRFAGSTRLTPSNTLGAGATVAGIYFTTNAGSFTLHGNPATLTGPIESSSSAMQTLAMPMVLGTGSTVLLRTILGSGNLILSGTISGEGHIEKQVQAVNATTAVLAGSNTYSGTTTLLAGNLSISSIKHMGSPDPSSVGMPSAGNGVIGLGVATRLIYTGAGDTTDRGIDLRGSPCRIVQAGGGLLNFTGAFTASTPGAKVLTLDGAGAGEVAGAIENPPSNGNTRIVKEGAGVWTLSGANTFAGNTTVNAGTLALGVDGSLQPSSSAIIAAGATFDVSARASPYTWGGEAALTASGTGVGLGTTAAALRGAPGGIIDLGTRPITLAFAPAAFTGDTTHPALYIPDGTLSLGGNAFTVQNASGSPLAAGTYRLVEQASGSIMSSGGHAVSVTGASLAPTNAGATLVVTGAYVNLVVFEKAVPTVITPPSAAPILQGQSLAASVLSGGTASVAGAFAFTSPGVTPGVGTADQSVTFTPADTTNYLALLLDVTVTVAEPTRIPALHLDAGGFALEWSGSNAWRYTVETTHALQPAMAWSNLAGYADLSGVDGLMSAQDTNALPDIVRFYRVSMK